MPVKFGPEGYTSSSVRRYRQQQPLDIERAVAPGGRGMRGLGVMLVVCVVLAAVFYLGRTQPSPVSMTEEGKVVAKDTIVTKEGGGRRVLGISLPLPNGGQRNVVIECSEEQWQQFRIGDTVVAHFTTPRAGGDVVVTSIESKPAAVEL